MMVKSCSVPQNGHRPLHTIRPRQHGDVNHRGRRGRPESLHLYRDFTNFHCGLLVVERVFSEIVVLRARRARPVELFFVVVGIVHEQV